MLFHEDLTAGTYKGIYADSVASDSGSRSPMGDMSSRAAAKACSLCRNPSRTRCRCCAPPSSRGQGDRRRATLCHRARHLRVLPQRHAGGRRLLQSGAHAVQRHPHVSDLRCHRHDQARRQCHGRHAWRGLVERAAELRQYLEPLRRPAVAACEARDHLQGRLVGDSHDQRPHVEVLRQGPGRLQQPGFRGVLRRGAGDRGRRLGHGAYDDGAWKPAVVVPVEGTTFSGTDGGGRGAARRRRSRSTSCHSSARSATTPASSGR